MGGGIVGFNEKLCESNASTGITDSFSDKDEHTDQDYDLFIDLIKLMLTYEPAHRVKPLDALTHPFLHGEILRTFAENHPSTQQRGTGTHSSMGKLSSATTGTLTKFDSTMLDQG